MPEPDVSSSSDSSARLPAGERRRQIIDVAIDVFSRRGFNGTTTKQIAAAAGVTEAIIFRHFANKEQLYTAILERRTEGGKKEEWLKKIQGWMAADDDEQVIREIVSTIIGVFHQEAKFERVMLYASLEGNEIASMYREQFTIRIVELLRGYIARRQNEGALRAMDPGLVIFAAAGMAQQYGIHTHLCGGAHEGVTDQDAIDAFTRILMNGIQLGAPEGR